MFLVLCLWCLPFLSMGVRSRVSNVSNTFLCKKHLKTLYVKQKGWMYCCYKKGNRILSCSSLFLRFKKDIKYLTFLFNIKTLSRFNKNSPIFFCIWNQILAFWDKTCAKLWLIFWFTRWYSSTEQSLEKLHFNASIWYNIRQNFCEEDFLP